MRPFRFLPALVLAGCVLPTHESKLGIDFTLDSQGHIASLFFTYQGKTCAQWLDRITSPDPAERRAAAEAFGEFPLAFGFTPPSATNAPKRVLLTALKDTDADVRKQAAASLGKLAECGFPDEGEVPALLEAMNDPDPGVALQAEMALDKADGKGILRKIHSRVRPGTPVEEAKAALEGQGFTCKLVEGDEPHWSCERRLRTGWFTEEICRVAIGLRDGVVTNVTAYEGEFERRPIKEKLERLLPEKYRD